MKTDLFGIHYFFHCYGNVLDISVVKIALNNQRRVPTWEKEVWRVAGAFPSFFGYDFFSLVVDIENGCLEGVSFFMPKGMKDRYWA